MDEKQREERGPNTPGISLPNTVDLLKRVRDGVGMSRASRETVAQALGYTSMSGTARRALAALTHFGLMERSGAAAMQISSLGRRLLVPRDEREAQEALAEAAAQPALYRKLIDRFAGHALPNLLPNILIRDFGVFSNSSNDVAAIFRESVEFAGLLQNGVLSRGSTHDAATETASDRVDAEEVAGSRGGETQGSDSGARSESVAVPAGMQRYTIPLDTNGRVASIDIPLPVAAGDLRKVRKWAEYMASLSEDDE